MVNNILKKGKKFIISPQESVLSAATIIMLMIIASRVLGVVRQRVLAHFFPTEQLSLFFAAFRLPDLLFEVLVFGTFSSAFIPVFANLVKRKDQKAWETAAYVANIGMITFFVFAITLSIFSKPLYSLLAPGYEESEIVKIATLARVLFAAQGFFVISYVLTGVLESLKRFFIPALAPLFYNLGIIVGTIVLTKRYGLMAPTYGVVAGAFLHFAVQLPLALRLGFRVIPKIALTPHVKKIGRLALPRIIEVGVLQGSKMAELFFASLISKAAYTYFTFGNSLQLMPVGIFGTSIAKAALPSLSVNSDNLKEFKRILFNALYDMSFFVIPISAFLIVLRIPIVRIAYGTDIFSWESTVQTGYVLTAFSVGIFFQAASSLLARSFYALHDTKTPVLVSVTSIMLIIFLDYVFIGLLSYPAWGLALAFTIGSALQALTLFFLVSKRLKNGINLYLFMPFIKAVLAAVAAVLPMFFVLKLFDRSVWVKRLSFVGSIQDPSLVPIEGLTLDTRYVINLLILTVFTTALGFAIYLVVSVGLKSDQAMNFFSLLRRIFIKRKVEPVPAKEEEVISPITTETET